MFIPAVIYLLTKPLISFRDCLPSVSPKIWRVWALADSEMRLIWNFLDYFHPSMWLLVECKHSLVPWSHHKCSRAWTQPAYPSISVQRDHLLIILLRSTLTPFQNGSFGTTATKSLRKRLAIMCRHFITCQCLWRISICGCLWALHFISVCMCGGSCWSWATAFSR